MLAFTEDLEARGMCKASSSLKFDSEGMRIDVRDGKRIVLDGPFA